MSDLQHRVLVTDKVHKHLLISFQNRHWVVDYQPDISYDDAKAIISDYTGVIINSKIKATKEFLDLASQLKFIGRLGSGLEIIDLEYAAANDIKVYNSPEGLSLIHI